MSDVMKNVVFTGVKQVEIQEHPLPAVSDDEVLVKIESCAICTWEQRVYTGVKKVDFPFIGGHEIAAEIIEMGKNTDKRQFKVGDKVVVGMMMPCKNCFQCRNGNEQNCEHFDHSALLPGMPHKGMGGLSSHMLVKPQNLFKYSNVTPDEACITEPISCVIHSVETADIQFGDTVVVIGCGIMGLLHVLLAVKKGAMVIASDVNEERTKLAMQLGARYAVNPAAEVLEQRVAELTGGDMAQVVFDTTPISKVAEDAMKCLGNNSRLVLYSSFYPDTPVSISPDWLHKSASQLLGTANSNTRDFTRATRMLSGGMLDVKPFISEVYQVEDVVQALESASKGDKYRVIVKF